MEEINQYNEVFWLWVCDVIILALGEMCYK